MVYKFLSTWVERVTQVSATWISILRHYLTPFLKPTPGSILEKEYWIGTKKFLQVWKIKKGPSPILAVEGVKEASRSDIFDLIVPYFNPEGNICSELITPRYIGMEQVIVQLIDGRELIFTKDQPITID